MWQHSQWLHLYTYPVRLEDRASMESSTLSGCYIVVISALGHLSLSVSSWPLPVGIGVHCFWLVSLGGVRCCPFLIVQCCNFPRPRIDNQLSPDTPRLEPILSLYAVLEGLSHSQVYSYAGLEFPNTPQPVCMVTIKKTLLTLLKVSPSLLLLLLLLWMDGEVQVNTQ